MKAHNKVVLLLITMTMVSFAARLAPAQAPAGDKQEAMAKLQKISAALKLTPEQKQKMLPILMEEGSKMKALKSDTSLGPLQKGMQMKQVGSEMDGKVKPILSDEQYTKYEQIRAQERQEMMEKMRSGKQ